MLPTKTHHGNCSLLHMFSSTAWKPLHFFTVSQIEMNRKSWLTKAEELHWGKCRILPLYFNVTQFYSQEAKSLISQRAFNPRDIFKQKEQSFDAGDTPAASRPGKKHDDDNDEDDDDGGGSPSRFPLQGGCRVRFYRRNRLSETSRFSLGFHHPLLQQWPPCLWLHLLYLRCLSHMLHLPPLQHRRGHTHLCSLQVRHIEAAFQLQEVPRRNHSSLM